MQTLQGLHISGLFSALQTAKKFSFPPIFLQQRDEQGVVRILIAFWFI